MSYAPLSDASVSVRRSDNGARALVIDDEEASGSAARFALFGAGLRVEWVTTARAGMDRIGVGHPDIVLLDLNLPDMDGIKACRALRAWTNVPIIILSVRDKDDDKIAALDGGADDYLTKPFSNGELLARVRVALRHAAHATADDVRDPVFHTSDLQVDFTRRLVTVGGQEVHLNPTEYEVLKYLAQHAGQVVTHRTMLRVVWGPLFEDAVQNLRVTIATIRRKIERDPARPKLLITDPGVGYRLRSDEM